GGRAGRCGLGRRLGSRGGGLARAPLLLGGGLALGLRHVRAGGEALGNATRHVLRPRPVSRLDERDVANHLELGSFLELGRRNGRNVGQSPGVVALYFAGARANRESIGAVRIERQRLARPALAALRIAFLERDPSESDGPPRRIRLGLRLRLERLLTVGRR